MTDFNALEAVDKILEWKHGENPPEQDNLVISGALVIGLYVDATGDFVATWHAALGGMHAYAQEGVLRERLRELTTTTTDDDDDSEEPS